jgi:uncharacterized membrane protein
MNRDLMPYVARVVHARPRLAVSVLAGVVAGALVPGSWPPWSRALLGWDFGVALYLVLSFYLMAQESAPQIRRRAALEDEGRILILTLTVAAALASLFAIVIQLGIAAERGHHWGQLVFATATIILSWFFMHSIFAVHYAHEFYGDTGGKGGGLKFPGNDKPDYWDFMYFSFVIGMTSQVSDVGVSDQRIRRLVGVHGVISFFFNIAILALTFNIAASAIQKS